MKKMKRSFLLIIVISCLVFGCSAVKAKTSSLGLNKIDYDQKVPVDMVIYPFGFVAEIGEVRFLDHSSASVRVDDMDAYSLWEFRESIKQFGFDVSVKARVMEITMSDAPKAMAKVLWAYVWLNGRMSSNNSRDIGPHLSRINIYPKVLPGNKNIVKVSVSARSSYHIRKQVETLFSDLTCFVSDFDRNFIEIYDDKANGIRMAESQRDYWKRKKDNRVENIIIFDKFHDVTSKEGISGKMMMGHANEIIAAIYNHLGKFKHGTYKVR